ncbi:hypothetical protein [Streptomyces sp. NPDC001930]|uniref:hypothetical protein n=1 Tax=Streptomyces sp. NPDC001930 TaxID=3364625 RepID=UPI0036B3F869
MAGQVRIVFRGRPAFGGHWVDCPETPHFPAKLITLYVTPAGVAGTCGKTHRVRDDNGRRGKPSECIFQVTQVTREELQALAAPGKTGRVRGKLPTGKSVDVQIISLGAGTGVTGGKAGGGKAAQAFGAAKNGKGAAAPARVPRGGGGAATAFFGAIAATAGAVGQVAGSAASIVSSAADLGKEGVGLARDGVKEAGAYGSRRHERKMRGSGSDDD